MKNITDIYEASILGDLNDTLDYGDKYADAYNFINWWMDSSSDDSIIY